MKRQSKDGRSIFAELIEGVNAMGKRREGTDTIDQLQMLPKRVARATMAFAPGAASSSTKGKAKKGFNSSVLGQRPAE
jgi:hypothetical protein